MPYKSPTPGTPKNPDVKKDTPFKPTFKEISLYAKYVLIRKISPIPNTARKINFFIASSFFVFIYSILPYDFLCLYLFINMEFPVYSGNYP